ncbi:hypothetical protein [Paenibacillus thermotolerans]|uniref:hypothetical protein n=1 Tax=Paenibacillus thermotolerans TaxID=3027807 RepID=UPI0023682837|nr:MULTISPECIES: hypothetical protein [unclassified Paenibacillus]
MRKWKYAVILPLALSLTGVQTAVPIGQAFTAAASEASMNPMYDEIIMQESAWLSAMQFDSGAIPVYIDPLSNYGDKYKVVPYFTHFGLLGLLENSDNADVVRKYMDWYFSHLNRTATPTTPEGSVYDYYIETDQTTETPTYDFDSTDSYASTFLNVARKYAEVTGDTNYLTEHKDDLLLIARAMLSTMQSDGLTLAKPSWPVKYLMDNSEVYAGLADMEWIAQNVFGDEAAAAVYRQHKEDVYSAIQNELWSDTRQTYAHAKMNDGSLLYPDWNNFYADATSQLFPIWNGIIEPDSERALQLYNSFNLHHPGWPELNKSDAFPWAIIAYTAALMGDRVRVDRFLESVKTAYIDQAHPWPWYVMESGVTMLTASVMKRLPETNAEWTMDMLEDGAVIQTLPFAVTGTASGIADVEMSWTNAITGQTQTFHASPANGKWQLSIEGLTNGDYSVVAKAVDRFANVIGERRLQARIRIESENGIAEAVVQSDRNALRRGEATQLKVTAYAADGQTTVDLTNAAIDYRTNEPDLVSIDEQGVLTLKGLRPDMSDIQVWAFITNGNELVQSDRLTIPVSHEAMSLADAVLDKAAAWISGRQLDNGALVQDAEGTRIVASSSNIGALGLLVREETVPNAKRYIDWYVSHWNWADRYGIYGTIYNFSKDPSNGQWVSTGEYESASPTTASFISLVKKHYEKTGQMPLSQYQLDVITGGIGIMRSQDADGLMWKRPDDLIKLLQHNAVTNQGMKDSVWLFRNYFQASGPANYFESFATLLQNGIQKELWNSQDGSYYLSKTGSGDKQAPDWSNAADAAAQLAPIYTGVIRSDSEEARQLYAAYNLHRSGWETNAALTGDAAPVVFTAAIMGDPRASVFLGRLIDAMDAGTDVFSSGWTVGQVGTLMLASEQVRIVPGTAQTAIEHPTADHHAKGVSLPAKGTATGAKTVRIELRERFGTDSIRATAAVNGSGKWEVPLTGLKRGVEYELTVYALDAHGYPVQGASAAARFTIEAP